MIRKNWKEWLKCCNNKKKGQWHYSVLLTPFSHVKKKKKGSPFPEDQSWIQHSSICKLLVVSFIHFSHFSPPLCIVPPRRSCHPLTVGDKLLQLLPVTGFFFHFFFFFLWERLSNACLLHSEGLAAGSPSLPLLPWQCCTVIDKVDKEMLGHAPDRLDLKSPRWGSGSSQTAYTKSPDNQRLTEEFGSSAGSGKNVIFCRFVFFGPSCLQCCRQISVYGTFGGLRAGGKNESFVSWDSIDWIWTSAGRRLRGKT